MYLNESDAKKAIEDIVITHATHVNDFRLYPVNRKPNGAKQVSVSFILKVKNVLENEILFNEFMKVSTNEENFEIIESELIYEDKVLKEIFTIKCDISIFGI